MLSLRVLRYLKKLGIAYGVHQTRKEDYADVLTSSTRSWPLHLREHDVLHHDPRQSALNLLKHGVQEYRDIFALLRFPQAQKKLFCWILRFVRTPKEDRKRAKLDKWVAKPTIQPEINAWALIKAACRQESIGKHLNPQRRRNYSSAFYIFTDSTKEKQGSNACWRRISPKFFKTQNEYILSNRYCRLVTLACVQAGDWALVDLIEWLLRTVRRGFSLLVTMLQRIPSQRYMLAQHRADRKDMPTMARRSLHLQHPTTGLHLLRGCERVQFDELLRNLEHPMLWSGGNARIWGSPSRWHQVISAKFQTADQAIRRMGSRVFALVKRDEAYVV